MILKLLSAAAAVLALTAQQSAAQFTLALPDREVTVKYSDGTTNFKGAPIFGEPGQPSLPGYKVTFLLPDGVDPKNISVTIENPIEEVVRGTFTIKPALPPTVRGEIVWPTNKNILNGMDMDVYGKNEFFPADFKGAVNFGKMKQYQLIDVVINPFRYNPITRQLKKITGGTLIVSYPQGTSSFQKSTSPATSATKKVDGKTEKFLRKKAANPDVIDSYEDQTKSTSATSATTLAAAQAVTPGEGYAIITRNAIVSASTQLQNLITQKRNAGYTVILATETQWGGGTGDVAAERIRLWLQQNVSTQNLSYVLFIGNPDPATGDVPMKMCWPRLGAGTYEEAPTDFYYAELSGNWDLNGNGSYGEEGGDYGPDGGADIYAEVAVGRIPYYGSITTLDKILAKSIAYANETSRGWRNSVLLPMVPSDASTPGFYLGEEIKNNYLSSNNWKSFRIYDRINGYTQQTLTEVAALTPAVERTPCNTIHVEDAWKKNPFGLVIWWTHGSQTGAADIFNSSQTANLNNNFPSMTFQVSCLNAYPEDSTNLSYSLLRNGAVSAISATRVSWYYLGQNSNYLNSGSNAGMGYTYGLYMTSGEMSTGDALNAVKSDGGVFWMNELVFNVYGCPDLTLNVDKFAPTKCRTNASSPSRIQITWLDNSITETGYRIERATGNGSFAEIATVGADVSVYTNDGLTANTKYRYRVRSYSASGTSDCSNIDSTTTFTNIAPGKTVTASSQQSGNGIANAIDNNATSTRWAASSGTMPQWYKVDLGADRDLSGCEIVFERTGTSGDCNDFIVSTSSDNSTWAEQVNRSTNTNTAPTQAYTFQATARYVRITISDAPGTYYASMYEFRVFGQTVPSNPKWNSPVNLPDIEQIQLSWQPSAGATSYTVYQAQLGQPRFVIASGLTTTTFTTTGLIGGKNYIFSIVAYNAAGHSTDMEPVAETWVTAPMLPPIAPSELSIRPSGSTNGYLLNWRDNATNADGFEIERRIMNTSTWSVIGSASSLTSEYLDQSVNNSTSYEYRIRATNMAGFSEYSEIVNTLIPPAAPSINTTIYDGVSTISLAWVYNGAAITGFKLERSTDGSNYDLIATLGPNVISYANTGVANDNVYMYRLYAYNSYGNSDYSYTNAATKPNAPSNLTATLSGTEVTLSWTDNSSSENGFIIEQAVGGGDFSEVGTVWSNSYSNSSLSLSTAYRFRVRAYNSYSSAGYVISGYSNVVTITTPAVILNAPSALSITQFNFLSGYSISWQNNSSDATGFEIARRDMYSSTWTVIGTTSSPATTYLDLTANNSSSYEYRVRAYNATNSSNYSEVVTTFIAPPAPLSFSPAFDAGTATITLNWSYGNSSNMGFYLERSIDGTNYTLIASLDPTVTSYVNTEITNGYIYTYRIWANNYYGNSDSVYTTVATTPMAPGDLTAALNGTTGVTLNWIDNSYAEDGFSIEQAIGNGAFAEIGTANQNYTTYTVNGLSQSSTYRFRIRAFNSQASNGYIASEYSNIVTITIPPPIPSAPANLNATAILKDHINLSWTDNANNENGFYIERSTAAAGPFTQIASVGANVTTYASTGLTPSTAYWYRVRAYNAGGNSAFSNTATATTLMSIPNSPATLTATAVSSSQINLSWIDASNDESGFYIEWATTSAGPFTRIATLAANVSSYSSTGLTASTVYWYRAIAYNAIGNSPYSNQTTATTLAATPTVPSNIVATVNSRTQITLTWTDNATNESGFYIERATASAGPFTQIASVGANVLTYANTGLTVNTAYWYRVRAYNANGNSAYTATVTATTHSNLSTSGTASAQSQQTGNLAANAKDNSTTTRWAASSGTMPQWWKIDLGSSKTLSEVEVMFERVGTTGDCNDFKVETSTDNATWTSRVDKTTNTNTVQTQAYPFSATARYVRITFSDAPGTYYASMFEFRVFGK